MWFTLAVMVMTAERPMIINQKVISIDTAEIRVVRVVNFQGKWITEGMERCYSICDNLRIKNIYKGTIIKFSIDSKRRIKEIIIQKGYE